MKIHRAKYSEFEKNIAGKQIILFGASSVARNFLTDFEVADQIVWIADNDPKKNNTIFQMQHHSYHVYNPDYFEKADLNTTVIVITSSYFREITEQLQKIAVLETIDCYIYSEFEKSPYWEYTGVQLEDKDCCGCSACAQICPKQCISMEFDGEGFLYPVIHQDSCIQCGRCNAVCPLKEQFIRKESKPEIYCIYNKDTAVMHDSSSGGVFSLLAEEIINRGGIVYGAESSDGINVCHTRADSLEDYVKFRKSKYSQSNVNDCYRKAKDDLENSRTVLFSGTPCQIAGLYCFLEKDYKNLYTTEVICHGVPSQTVLNRYRQEIEKQKGATMLRYDWRYMEKGWQPQYCRIEWSDGSYTIREHDNEMLFKGFLSNIFLRPSCYDCHFSRIPRIADITLGDFLNYIGPLKKENQNQGLSLMLLSTNKGKELFDKISAKTIYESADIEYAINQNYHLNHIPYYNRKRPAFFQEFNTGISYAKLAEKYLGIKEY